MIDEGVHRNESFDTAILQNVRIRFKKFWIVTMSDDKEEEILLPQVSFNAADNRRAIEVPDLLGDDADHISAFYPQIASVKTGTVVQLPSGPQDSFLSMRGHRLGRSRLIQYCGANPLGQPHALRDHFQGHSVRLFRTGSLVWPFHPPIAPEVFEMASRCAYFRSHSGEHFS